MKTKYESRTTAIKLKGIYGSVHCSVCYLNDEPNTLSFTQHRTDKNGVYQYHSIPIYKDDLKKLVELLKENELI